ncbi:GntR family transcriptional regulator [Nocardioides sp. GY 10127]|uniref:GntR family transcriptional regulator n=1 Tax=Nocardioides sp. GY 10127 TaxID=2569762 RepID=UPI0010A87779|nr:GntR family transcriptional regulator [Nocardioides sp. GY 10127]TIC79311.1 GntR family transcriptional regulator [Nocardioides sp. GY 10127]
MSTPAPGVSSAAALSKSQQAYEWIRAQIVAGSFGAGYRLVLTDLADQLSMSVVPIREAIRQLTAEGLVTFERNVGARVARVDAEQYRWAMQVISVVESAATALASRHLTPDDLRTAREINERLRAGVGDAAPRALSELNQEFHRTLYGPCPNPRMLELVQREWERLGAMRHSIFTAVPGRAAISVAEHDRLLDLIEAEAPLEEVEEAVRSHRVNALTAFLTSTRGA